MRQLTPGKLTHLDHCWPRDSTSSEVEASRDGHASDGGNLSKNFERIARHGTPPCDLNDMFSTGCREPCDSGKMIQLLLGDAKALDA